MNARLRWIPFLTLLLALAAPPFAAPLVAQGDLKLSAAFEPATAKPGAEVVLVLTATVSDGFHAYGTKETTNVPVALPAKNLKLGGLEAVGKPDIPPGERTSAHGFETHPLPQTFLVKQKLKVPANVATNAVTVSGELEYQICDDSSCLPPAKEPFTAKLVIDGAAAAPQQPEPQLGVKPGLKLEPDAKLTVTATVTGSPARAGEPVTLVLECAVADEYHVYGTSNKVGPPVALDASKLQAGGLEPAGTAIVPPGTPVQKHGMTEFRLTDTFKVEQLLKVPADAKPGSITIRGELAYMACDESHCEPAATAPFEATLAIEAGQARTELAVRPDPPDAPSNGELRQPKYTLDDVGGDDAMSGSLWSLILLAIAGGLFALAMPCTYPMIPITFSFFTKQADRMHGKVLPLALTYGIGIVLMFVLVGVAIGGPIIAFAGHWATNLVIGVAFVAFALSLFGFFTLQLPSFVTNAAGKASTTGGLVGVFLMGATLVVSSFTCTAPIVGALLAGVAEGGYGRVALGMAVFGLTMAAPFVFLALLPGRVKALPKSGEWMHTLKVSLGFVELAAALKFLSNVDLARGWQMLPREAFLMIWAFTFVVLALFLFGLLGHRGETVVGTSVKRTGFGLVSLAFAFYCLFGTMGFALDPIMTAFEPPYRLRPVDEHTIVKDDQDSAVALAEREKKYVLINFTGFT